MPGEHHTFLLRTPFFPWLTERKWLNCGFPGWSPLLWLSFSWPVNSSCPFHSKLPACLLNLETLVHCAWACPHILRWLAWWQYGETSGIKAAMVVPMLYTDFYHLTSRVVKLLFQINYFFKKFIYLFFYVYRCFTNVHLCGLCACLVPVDSRRGCKIPYNLTFSCMGFGNRVLIPWKGSLCS